MKNGMFVLEKATSKVEISISRIEKGISEIQKAISEAENGILVLENGPGFPDSASFQKDAGFDRTH